MVLVRAELRAGDRVGGGVPGAERGVEHGVGVCGQRVRVWGCVGADDGGGGEGGGLRVCWSWERGWEGEVVIKEERDSFRGSIRMTCLVHQAP